MSTAGDEDGGRQFERTALAHWRTTLASAVAGLLIIRSSTAGPERVVVLIGCAIALLTVGGAGAWRQFAFDRRDATVRPVLIAAIAGALVLFQVLALVVVM